MARERGTRIAAEEEATTKTSRRQLGVSIKAADNQFSCQCSNLCCCAPLYAHGQLSSQRFRTKVPLLFSSLRAFLNFTTYTTIGEAKQERKLSQFCWQKWDQKSGFHCHFIEFKFTPMLASTFALAFLTMGFTFGQSHFFHSRSCRWLHSTILRPKGLFLKRRWSLKVWIVWHKRTKRVPFWCKALKIRIRNGFTKVLSRGCRYFVCANYNWNWLISPKNCRKWRLQKKLWNWLFMNIEHVAWGVTKSCKSIGTNTKVEID